MLFWDVDGKLHSSLMFYGDDWQGNAMDEKMVKDFIVVEESSNLTKWMIALDWAEHLLLNDSVTDIILS